MLRLKAFEKKEGNKQAGSKRFGALTKTQWFAKQLKSVWEKRENGLWNLDSSSCWFLWEQDDFTT